MTLLEMKDIIAWAFLACFVSSFLVIALFRNK